MPDLKKVLKGLECHLRELSIGKSCFKCPYINSAPCEVHLTADAIELLKAQMPVKPNFDFNGDMVCGNCRELIDKQYDKCPKCGRKVKWDE